MLLLDAGCGVGRISIPCSKAGAKVIGIDISKKAISIAHGRSKTNMSNCHFLVADAEFLPFRDNHFDLILFMGTLEYVSNPGRIFKESHMILKSNGNILFNVWNKHGYDFISLITLKIVNIFRKYKRTKDPFPLYMYSVREIREKLYHSKFKSNIKGYLFLTKFLVLRPLSYMLNRSKYLLHFFIRLERLISSSFLGPYVSSNQIIIGRKINSMTK